MTQATTTSRPLGRVVVLLPTFNERANLPGVVRRTRAAVPQADILVLDDNSPDGTGEAADDLASADPQVRVRHRAAKLGLGAAYLEGFRWALERGYDAVVEMDADGSHQPEQLPTLLHAAGKADLVIGSRWVAGGSVVNWPLHRQALSVGANAYTRFLLGMSVKDATAGYRVYRTTALRGLQLSTVSSQGYCFQVDMTWRAVRAGLTVVEVPIEFVEREVGDSKMSRDIVRESLHNITVWGLAHRAEQARERVRTIVEGRREAQWHEL